MFQTLIKRLATRENQLRKNRKSSFILYRWKRLSAVKLYQHRFGSVPELLAKRSLPNLRSYYINNGVYVWPSNS